MKDMDQQQLNEHLIRENIRLQGQVNFLAWLLIDYTGRRFDKSSITMVADPSERSGGMQEFLIEARKKFEIPLIEASPLLNQEEKDKYLAEVNAIKYIPPKPKKWVPGHDGYYE